MRRNRTHVVTLTRNAYDRTPHGAIAINPPDVIRLTAHQADRARRAGTRIGPDCAGDHASAEEPAAGMSDASGVEMIAVPVDRAIELQPQELLNFTQMPPRYCLRKIHLVPPEVCPVQGWCVFCVPRKSNLPWLTVQCGNCAEAPLEADAAGRVDPQFLV